MQIEGVLNSRPITLLSTESSDPYPLTPAHFLIGRQLTLIFEPNLQEIPEMKLSSY